MTRTLLEVLKEKGKQAGGMEDEARMTPAAGRQRKANTDPGDSAISHRLTGKNNDANASRGIEREGEAGGRAWRRKQE